MPAKPTKPRSGGSYPDFNQPGGWADLDRQRGDQSQLPAERGARPGVPIPRAPRDIGRPGSPPMVDWTEEDSRALEKAKRANPAHSGRGVPRAGGFKVPGVRWRNLNPLGGRVGQLIDIAEGIDDWARNPVPWKPSQAFAPYTVLKCNVGPTPQYPRVTHRGTRSGLVNSTDCGLSGQAWENAPCVDAVGTGVTNANRTFITLAKRSGDPALCPATNLTMRFRYIQVWWFVRPAGLSIPAGVPVFQNISVMPWGDSDPAADPNNRRNEAAADPAPPRAGEPHPMAGANPSPVTTITFPGMGLPGLDAAPDLSQGSQPWVFTQPGTQTDAPIGRNPPVATGERERKFITRTQRVGQAIFQVLDTASEWAEVVDCIYGSLPKKTRDRWEKDRGLHWVKVKTPYRPGGVWVKTKARKGLSIWETAGQYGLDGADWKSEAIWHNLDKVDMDASLRCMAANHVEDMIIGGIQRRLPRNTGGALDQGNQALAEALNWAQEALGV